MPSQKYSLRASSVGAGTPLVGAGTPLVGAGTPLVGAARLLRSFAQIRPGPLRSRQAPSRRPFTMPPVTLNDVIRVASARCVVLSAETAGYAILAAADEAIQQPVCVAAAAVELNADGTMWVRQGRRCGDAEAAASLRVLLSQLLAVAPSSCAALSSAARPRAPSDGIGRFVGEVEAALIPVNRAAARRTLARLYRETQRARDQGRLDKSPAPTAISTDPSPQSESVFAIDEGTSLELATPTPSPLPPPPAAGLPLPPTLPECTERVPEARSADREERSAEYVCEGAAAEYSCETYFCEAPAEAFTYPPSLPPVETIESTFEQVEIEAAELYDIPVFVEFCATPFLGSVVTAVDAIWTDTPAPKDIAPHASAIPSRPTIDLASLIRTPPWPATHIDAVIAPESLYATVYTPPMPLHESASLAILQTQEEPWPSTGLVVVKVPRNSPFLDLPDEEEWFTSSADGLQNMLVATPSAPAGNAATTTDDGQDDDVLADTPSSDEKPVVAAPKYVSAEPAPPSYEPRRSDVAELVRSFLVADARTESEWSRHLKRSVGLDPTPPPPAELASRTPPPVIFAEVRPSQAPRFRIPRPRSRRWTMAGAAVLALAFMGVDLRPRTASHAPVVEECRVELLVKAAVPGSEVRVRSAEGVELRRVRATATQPLTISKLPCRKSIELLISESGDGTDPKWVRIALDGPDLTPRYGENAVRRTVTVR